MTENKNKTFSEGYGIIMEPVSGTSFSKKHTIAVVGNAKK
jgi:hypothetical protein